MLASLLLMQLTIPAPAWSGAPVPLAATELTETSALVPSPSRPGVFWTLNDSGNPAELFAIDTAGRDLGRVRIRGARNIDWEALASGPCPRRRPAAARTRCLYIGDIGDNARARRYITIYRVPEPRPGEDTEVRALDSLRVVYPDSARDAEAMVVDARGDVLIISKELVREPRIYRVAVEAWTRRGPARARYEATLPIPSASGVEQWTTDAAWVRNGAALAVRTYGALWLVPFVRGRPVAARTRPLCRLAGLGPQGEGVAWIERDLYALTSEKLFRTAASITLVRCTE